MKYEFVKCPRCGGNDLVKDGNYDGMQGYRCKTCKKRFSEGKYDINLNKKVKLPPKEFDLMEYVDKLDWRNKRLAQTTAKKIARRDRKEIEEQLMSNLFKGNEDLDYGIIKILIFTNGWGIEKLLEVTLGTDVALTRFNIATIAKNLATNIQYSWKYIMEWLNEYPKLFIRRDIISNNFKKTNNKFENYQFIISRFFYKLYAIEEKKLRYYININDIEKLIKYEFYNKFKNINFDKYGYNEDYTKKMTEVEYSLRRLMKKLNTEMFNDEMYTHILSKLGHEWEDIALQIIKSIETKSIIKTQEMYDNYKKSDISIYNGKRKKIIECKLNATNKELIETIIKYGEYCDELEIWSLSNNIYNTNYENIDIMEIYNKIEKTKYGWYIKNDSYNKNLQIKIFYLENILNMVQNEAIIEKIKTLYYKYEKTGIGIERIDIKRLTELQEYKNYAAEEEKHNTKERQLEEYQQHIIIYINKIENTNDLNQFFKSLDNIYIDLKGLVKLKKAYNYIYKYVKENQNQFIIDFIKRYYKIVKSNILNLKNELERNEYIEEFYNNLNSNIPKKIYK